MSSSSTIDRVRFLAILTGLLLTGLYFVVMVLEFAPSPMIAMLATAIGGFEIFLFGQDQWLKRRGKHG